MNTNNYGNLPPCYPQGAPTNTFTYVQPVSVPSTGYFPQIPTQNVQYYSQSYTPVTYPQPAPQQMTYNTPIYPQTLPGYTQVVNHPIGSTKYNPYCPKCQGTGVTFKKGKPCKMCLMGAGICYKCGGRGFDHKGKACKICYYRNHGGSCPLCFGKKIISGKNKPCKLCKFVQKRTFAY